MPQESGGALDRLYIVRFSSRAHKVDCLVEHADGRISAACWRRDEFLDQLKGKLIFDLTVARPVATSKNRVQKFRKRKE